MTKESLTKTLQYQANLLVALLWVLVKIGYLGMAGYGIVLVLVWAFDRDYPTKIYSGFVIGTEGKAAITPGDLISVHWQLLKTRNCPGRTQRTLSGACGTHDLSITTPTAPARPSPQEFVINFRVPDSATPGTCEYNTHQEYWCNPLHLIFPLTKDFPTLFFNVEYDRQTSH